MHKFCQQKTVLKFAVRGIYTLPWDWILAPHRYRQHPFQSSSLR